LISIIGFILAAAIQKIDFIPVISNSAGVRFSFLFFTNIPHFVYMIPRNYGPFWEPGVFQSYLFAALFLVLFVKKDLVRFDAVLFIAAIITTFSTTGIIVLGIILAAYLISSSKGSRTQIKLLIFSLGILSILIVVSNINIWNALFSKLKEGIDNSSLAARWYSITQAFQSFIREPLLGVGIKQFTLDKNVFSALIPGQGALLGINTLMVQFAIFGLAPGLFYLIMLYRFIRTNTNGLLASLLVFTGFVVILSSENFIYSLFFNLIIFLRPATSENLFKETAGTAADTLHASGDRRSQ
jgi:hypothetical protein